MKCIFCILAILCGYLPVPAQTLNQPEPGLSIGQLMPPVMLGKLYNYAKKNVAFNAFQKQLTIIDFWNTSCGACLGSFPKLHDLQSQYAGRLQLLMVNARQSEDAKKVATFLQRRKQKTGMHFTLPYLLQDTVLVKLFPHQTIPHCVWIDQAGKIIAITEGRDVTAANVEAALKGEAIAAEFKNDALLFEFGKDELLPDTTADDSGLLYRSLLLAEKKGIGSRIFSESTKSGRIRSLLMTNYPLLVLYQMSHAEVFSHGISRLVIDSAVAPLFAKQADGNRGHKYSYELQGPAMQRSEALQWMAADLQRTFRVRAIAEERPTACYVMRSGPNVARIATKQGKPSTSLHPDHLEQFIINGKTELLRALLQQVLQQPVLDETALSYNIDLHFPTGFRQYNLQQLQQFLQQNGIDLQPATRPLMVPRLTSTLHNHLPNN